MENKDNKLTETDTKIEDEKCKHGTDNSECCVDCRKEEINFLIGMTGINNHSIFKNIDLFNDDNNIEIVVILVSNGGSLKHELGRIPLEIDIDDFEDVDTDDELSAVDQACSITHDKIEDAIKEIGEDFQIKEE